MCSLKSCLFQSCLFQSCVYFSHVYILVMCIFQSCVYFSHVYILVMCIFQSCVYFSHVYISIMCIFQSCVYFSHVFQQVENNSIEIWKYQMYFLVMEYENKTFLVPPFSIFQHIFLACRWVVWNTCRPHKTESMYDDLY